MKENKRLQILQFKVFFLVSDRFPLEVSQSYMVMFQIQHRAQQASIYLYEQKHFKSCKQVT